MTTPGRTSKTDRAPRRPRLALLAAALAAVLPWAAAPAAAQADSSLGFGVHAWRTVSDLRSEGFGNLRRSGVSWLLSYQYHPAPLLRLELDGEYFDKGFGGSTHYAIAPQAFVLIGSFLYGGLGVGTTYSRDFAHDFSSPFYVARAGLNLHLLPRISVDVNGNYHFHAWNQLRGVNTGTVTLGAIARVKL